MAICFGIVSIQIIGSIVWLLLDPPGTTILFPSRSEAVLTCKATASHLLISLLYNMLLIIACTLYAFKTRKIPENFNETRLIGFTMYSTSILWLSFGKLLCKIKHSIWLLNKYPNEIVDNTLIDYRQITFHVDRQGRIPVFEV